jgi:hypothetical protein
MHANFLVYWMDADGLSQITCLYDMDIVPDPPGTWNFNEVYLYEELMEADLHAIVSRFSCCR